MNSLEEVTPAKVEAWEVLLKIWTKLPSSDLLNVSSRNAQSDMVAPVRKWLRP